MVLLAVGLVLVVLVGVGGVALWRSTEGADWRTSDDEPLPTLSDVASPEPLDPSPSAPTTPDPGPTDPPTSSSPEITAEDVLERNDLYDAARLRGGGCAAESTVPLDGVRNVETYYASVLTCLNSTWQQVRRAGVPFRPARLVVHNGEPVSSCGAYTISFYCASEETIYMYAQEMIDPWLQYPTEYSHNITRLAAAHTIAHEYGHHLQQLSRMYAVLETDVRGTETERRFELQATCLANVFLAAQAGTYPVSAEDDANEELWRFIAVANHGSTGNQDLWSDRGYAGAEPGSCNTFTAPPREVA